MAENHMCVASVVCPPVILTCGSVRGGREIRRVHLSTVSLRSLLLNLPVNSMRLTKLFLSFCRRGSSGVDGSLHPVTPAGVADTTRSVPFSGSFPLGVSV
jgi:hypothetical protein